MKPSLEQVKTNLSIFGDANDVEINSIIDQANSEALLFIDRNVYATVEECTAANDADGIVVNDAFINAQILLCKYYFEQVGTEAGVKTQDAAYCLLRLNRKCGT